MVKDKKNDLTEMTAAEYLLFTSREYEGNARVSSVDGRVGAGLAMSPRVNNLPEASIEGSAGANQPTRASLSVGSDALRYSRQFETTGKNTGGTRTMDTVEGSMGPARGFYQQASQPGNQDSRTTSYGGNVEVGPVEFYASRDQSSQDVIPPQYGQYFLNPRYGSTLDKVGVTGSLPVGSGTLSGGINRQFERSLLPQLIDQASRPTAQSPNVTNYQMGYEGKVGPGMLGLQGNVTDVRNIGVEPSVRGSYQVSSPLGLGGSFGLTGSYVNPIGGDSASEAMLRYNLKF